MLASRKIEIDAVGNSLPKRLLWQGNAASMALYGMNLLGMIKLRGLAPEPFDYFNHVSNSGGSFFSATFVSYVGARIISKFDRSPQQVKWAASAIGATTLAAANLLTETKFGVGLSGIHNTIDPVDLAYGFAGGILGANMLDVRATDAAPTDKASLARPRLTVRPALS